MERLLPSVDGLVLATTRMPPSAILDVARRKSVALINHSVDGVRGVLPDVPAGVDQIITMRWRRWLSLLDLRYVLL